MSSTARNKYRAALRKEINQDAVKLTLDSLCSMENLEKLIKHGEILEASSTGLLIKVQRKDLLSPQLKSNLNIDYLLNKEIFLNIHEMNLEITGKVARTQFLGKEGFLIAIDYSHDAPEYWRECLMDLLPTR